jgi:hypothetical protein
MELSKIHDLQSNTHTIKQVKQILPAWIKVIEETRGAVVRKFRHRLLIVIYAHSAHFEHVFT